MFENIKIANSKAEGISLNKNKKQIILRSSDRNKESSFKCLEYFKNNKYFADWKGDLKKGRRLILVITFFLSLKPEVIFLGLCLAYFTLSLSTLIAVLARFKR